MSSATQRSSFFFGLHESYVSNSVLEIPEAFLGHPALAKGNPLVCLAMPVDDCVYFVPDGEGGGGGVATGSLSLQGARICGRVHPDEDGRMAIPQHVVRHAFGTEEFPALVKGCRTYFSVSVDKSAPQ
jgi:hypothetical protein